MNAGTLSAAREEADARLSSAFRGEIGFLVQSAGPCRLCGPRHVIGQLVAIVYRIAAPHVPIYRCAQHQQLPIDLEQPR